MSRSTDTKGTKGSNLLSIQDEMKFRLIEATKAIGAQLASTLSKAAHGQKKYSPIAFAGVTAGTLFQEIVIHSVISLNVKPGSPAGKKQILEFYLGAAEDCARAWDLLGEIIKRDEAKEAAEKSEKDEHSD